MSTKPSPTIVIEHSRNLGQLFLSQKFSLLATTYQAQRVLLFTGQKNGKLKTLNRSMPRPMGIALSGNSLAIGCKNAIWFFNFSSRILDPSGTPMPHDLTILPRSCHVTGDILIHQMIAAKNRLVFANTRFSCLSELASDASFKVIWKPSFISEIVPEDRCHLNGVAIRDGTARYVTIISKSNKRDGWRDNRINGGLVIDITSGETIASGLCMPHSPYWYRDRLWLLESGRGYLLAVDPKTGKQEKVAAVPGFARGLAIYKDTAFIGVSMIREKNFFGGLPIEAAGVEPICGIHIVDLKSRKLLGVIKIKNNIEELFDLEIIPGKTSPNLIGFEDEMIDQTFVVK